ncbi:hypothetical protein FNV43_RR03312 [Rhamnella rubrinervis]|uniref:Uncharacterized protein n=1 Tax=Rhamnella rubrinervis TaxID=2594499 RepID=A0A8K0HJM8_9ROSA|nr:hypothetical protein FNV43_RR03312 [Rhamnella rubrinervis]
MAWRTAIMHARDSLIFTFKIGEEGLAGWPVLHAILQAFAIHLHIGTAGWHGGPPSCSPDSLIFTFKIGEEGLQMAGPTPYRRPSSSNLHIWTRRMDGMEDRPSCSPYSLIFTFKIGEEGLQDGRPYAIIAGLPHPIFIYGPDGMEDRHPAGWHGGPAIMRPDSLIFTFKIGGKTAGWPPCHTAGLPHPIFIYGLAG